MNFIPRPAQRRILEYHRGKMGIAAVPGSGKTHTLSALAAQLIRTARLDDEQEILIVTLVNSAVDNFAARIKEFLGLSLPFGYRVRTLHGLAHDIVREKPTALGLDERFSIIDEREADLVRSDAVRAWLQVNAASLDEYLQAGMDESKRAGLQRKHLPELVNNIALAFIRSAKDNRLTVEKLHRLIANAPVPLPLAEMGLAIYSDYQRGLIYRSAVDFDDLIRLAIELLENDPEYLERLRYRWPYILEDEAQDSSKLQEEILRLLAGEGGNWVRVGDPNQAIFETFTTANPQHLLNFIHKESDQYHELPDSGRCQPSIIAMANHLISWVNNDHPEPAVRDALTIPFIIPVAEDDPQPNPADDPKGIKLIDRKYTSSEEISAVVKSIAQWLPDHPDSTVAVLVPRNARGAEVIETLKHTGLPYVELLGSTSSTRETARRLGDVAGSLADPQSPAKLARAYLAWRFEDETTAQELQQQVYELLSKCKEVERYTHPRQGNEWLSDLEGKITSDLMAELVEFQGIIHRWHRTALLPIDQMVLTLSQDLFTEPGDLALAHKLAIMLGQIHEAHGDWRLPELTGELGTIARNERRFLGFSEDDSGFDPSHHIGKVVVTTIHKAKGLEWDRVYIMSVNNYDFPSSRSKDRYISERWFIRDNLNLEAEALAQLHILGSGEEYEWYTEGEASKKARSDYIRERLRLFYVGITRARKELIITFNLGRQGNLTQALPFHKLQEWFEKNQKE